MNTQSIVWEIARAGGFTAYILLTLAVFTGAAQSLKWQSGRWPRMINYETHNFLTLLSCVFICVHVLAVWIDPFTAFKWYEVFVPFLSHYRQIWVALGIIAFYLIIATIITSLLRNKIGYKVWRVLHLGTFVVFLLTTAHGIATGSDTRTWWAALIYLSCFGSVSGIIMLRALTPAPKTQKTYPVVAMATGALLLVGILFTMVGPMQPGWNIIANNGAGSGSRITASNSATGTSTVSLNPTQQFTANVSGQYIQSTPDTFGNLQLALNLSFASPANGTLDITMQGHENSATNNDDDDDGNNQNRSSITITSTSVILSVPNYSQYSGQVTSININQQWYMQVNVQDITQQHTLLLKLILTVSSNGSVTGAIQGTPQ